VPIEMIKSADAKRALVNIVKPQIEARMFTPVSEGRWIRAEKGPIKELFTVGTHNFRLSGAGWISLDYVPHIYRQTVRWHRTPKNAMADIWFEGPGNIFFLAMSKGKFRSAIQELAPRVISASLKGYDSIRNVEDVVKTVLTHKAGGKRELHKVQSFWMGSGYWNYPQLQLTLAFSHAYLGEKRKAVNALQEFQKHYDEPRVVAKKLEELLDRQIAQPGCVPEATATRAAPLQTRRRARPVARTSR
jgi:hypothetical protein